MSDLNPETRLIRLGVLNRRNRRTPEEPILIAYADTTRGFSLNGTEVWSKSFNFDGDGNGDAFEGNVYFGAWTALEAFTAFNARNLWSKPDVPFASDRRISAGSDFVLSCDAFGPTLYLFSTEDGSLVTQEDKPNDDFFDFDVLIAEGRYYYATNENVFEVDSNLNTINSASIPSNDFAIFITHHEDTIYVCSGTKVSSLTTGLSVNWTTDYRNEVSTPVSVVNCLTANGNGVYVGTSIINDDDGNQKSTVTELSTDGDFVNSEVTDPDRNGGVEAIAASDSRVFYVQSEFGANPDETSLREYEGGTIKDGVVANSLSFLPG